MDGKQLNAAEGAVPLQTASEGVSFENVSCDEGSRAAEGRTPSPKRAKRSFGMFGTKAKIFYGLMLVFPILQFLFFYVGVNFNSLIMAFQRYDLIDGALQLQWAQFENFSKFFQWIGEGQAFKQLLGNTMIIYALGLFVGLGCGVCFSYYIYKRKLLSKFFRVMLFLPSILSAIVLSLMWEKFLNDGMINLLRDLLDNPDLHDLRYTSEGQFWMVAAFTVLMCFGSSVLLFTGTMDQIDESVSEYAKIDGCTALQEFAFVTVPMVFPTVRTFIIIGVGGIFTNQAYMLNFYSAGDPGDAAAPYSVFGYFFFRDMYDPHASLSTYPYMSAIGVVLTLVAIPLTFGVKYLLERFGPKED